MIYWTWKITGAGARVYIVGFIGFGSEEEGVSGDGATGTGGEVLQGVERRPRAFRAEHQGDSRFAQAADTGAGQQAGRAGEDGAYPRRHTGRSRRGPAGGRGRLYARLPHHSFLRRGAAVCAHSPLVGLGAHSLWY